MASIVELKTKRAETLEQARAKYSAAQKRDGGPTGEDKAEFDQALDAAEVMAADIKREERAEASFSDLETPSQRASRPLDSERRDRGGNFAEYRASKDYADVYGEWLKSGQMRWDRIPSEYRDTILGTDSKGGYLSTPTQLANELVKQVDNLVFIRPLATVVTLTDAKALGVPQLSTRMGSASWTTEVAAVTEDTTQALARRDLTPTPLTKLAKISIRTLFGAVGVETLIRDELAYAFAVSQENAFLNGTGSAQPLGVFTASASGIASGRDVATGNTSTAIVADNLFAVKYSLKQPYLADPSMRWCFHRDGVKMIMTLKDSQNRYLWEPSLQVGQPDRLLGIPVMTSEYAPNTFTTGLYVGILGAFRYYWIAQVSDIQIQRLVELYAATNEIGFIGRMFLDGSPVLSEAFARVKLG